MRKFNLAIQLFLLFTFLISCSDKEEVKPVTEEKSDAKSVVSFTLTALTPKVVGVIDEATQTISVVVPFDTDVTSLAPTIQVSDKAVVSPASGAAQDFSSPVKYKVTAEDGSSQEYEVKVAVEAQTGPTISLEPHVGAREVEQGAFLFVYGENFGTDASKAKIILESTSSETVIELPALAPLFSDARIVVSIPEDAPLEDYKVKVVVNNQSAYMEEVFTVVLPKPEIEEIAPLTVIRGEAIVISGKYFAEAGNEVIISKGTSKTSILILSESTTTIEARISSSQEPGEYSIMVKSNGKETHFSEKLTVNKPSTAPEITNIDKVSYNRGETMVITGKNLKQAGAPTYIYFMTWPSGVTIMRNYTVNAEGTEATFTIPTDFTTGTYTVYLSVNFEDTDDYKEIIQIK